jgi:hypothetical protein
MDLPVTKPCQFNITHECNWASSTITVLFVTAEKTQGLAQQGLDVLMVRRAPGLVRLYKRDGSDQDLYGFTSVMDLEGIAYP